jgi:LysM repeat protein
MSQKFNKKRFDAIVKAISSLDQEIGQELLKTLRDIDLEDRVESPSKKTHFLRLENLDEIDLVYSNNTPSSSSQELEDPVQVDWNGFLNRLEQKTQVPIKQDILADLITKEPYQTPTRSNTPNSGPQSSPNSVPNGFLSLPLTGWLFRSRTQ